MRHSRLVSPTLRSSESVVTTRPDGSSEPLDGSAVVRLRIAAVAWGVLWLLLGLVNKHLIAPGLALPADSDIPWPPAADGLALLCITLSALVYFSGPAPGERSDPSGERGAWIRDRARFRDRRD